jgi:hypothetical protein
MLIAVSVQYRASSGISLMHLAQIACTKYSNIQAGPRCSGLLRRVKTHFTAPRRKPEILHILFFDCMAHVFVFF